MPGKKPKERQRYMKLAQILIHIHQILTKLSMQ